MTTVIVVEPHALLRFGILQHLAKAMPEVRLEGGDYGSLSSGTLASDKGNLLLLSPPMDEQCAAQVQAALSLHTPARMVLLSDSSVIPASWQHLSGIIAGNIPPDVSPDVLAASIRLVLAGGRCFQMPTLELTQAAAPPSLRLVSESPKISCEPVPTGSTAITPLVRAVARPAVSSPLAGSEAEMLHLTPRQYEVLVLLARGYPIKTISRHLNISVATAKAHTETLYQRLNVHNRNQAVYTAISRGATLGWHQLDSYNAMEVLHSATAA